MAAVAGAAGLTGAATAGAAGLTGAAGASGFAGAGADVAAGLVLFTDLKGLIGTLLEGLKSSSRNSAKAFSASFVACAGDVKRFVLAAEG